MNASNNYSNFTTETPRTWIFGFTKVGRIFLCTWRYVVDSIGFYFLVLCDGPLKIEWLNSFFQFYAFGVKRGHIGYKKAYLELKRFELDSEVPRQHIPNFVRRMILAQWKTQGDNFSREIVAFFENEAAVGDGPRRTYFEMVRQHFGNYLLEGM